MTLAQALAARQVSDIGRGSLTRCAGLVQTGGNSSAFSEMT